MSLNPRNNEQRNQPQGNEKPSSRLGHELDGRIAKNISAGVGDNKRRELKDAVRIIDGERAVMKLWGQSTALQ